MPAHIEFFKKWGLGTAYGGREALWSAPGDLVCPERVSDGQRVVDQVQRSSFER